MEIAELSGYPLADISARARATTLEARATTIEATAVTAWHKMSDTTDGVAMAIGLKVSTDSENKDRYILTVSSTGASAQTVYDKTDFTYNHQDSVLNVPNISAKTNLTVGNNTTLMVCYLLHLLPP